MAKRKTGIGRGLSALIPAGSQTPVTPVNTEKGSLYPVRNKNDKNRKPGSSRNQPELNPGADSVNLVEEDAAATNKVSPAATIAEVDSEVGSFEIETNSTKQPGNDSHGETQVSRVVRPSDIFFEGGTGGSSSSHPRGGSVSELLSPKPSVSRETISKRNKKTSKPAKSANASGSLEQTVGTFKSNGSDTLRAADSAKAGSKESSQQLSSETKVLADVPGAHLAEVQVDAIHPNRNQPRQVFDPDELEELAESLREVGLLQPLVVRQDPDQDGIYEIVMGERRWRAAKLANFKQVPVIIRQVDSNDLLREALLENLHRVQLNPLEEAAAYQQLMQDFGCTQAQLSKRVARSRSQIANTLRLLRLPASVQSKIAAGVLSAGHARALLGLSEPDEQIRLAERIIAEGLSVRTTEELVALGFESNRKIKRSSNKDTLNSLPLPYQQVAEQWTDLFDTRVSIKQGKHSSKLIIEFTDEADLHRITGILGKR